MHPDGDVIMWRYLLFLVMSNICQSTQFLVWQSKNNWQYYNYIFDHTTCLCTLNCKWHAQATHVLGDDAFNAGGW